MLSLSTVIHLLLRGMMMANIPIIHIVDIGEKVLKYLLSPLEVQLHPLPVMHFLVVQD